MSFKRLNDGIPTRNRKNFKNILNSLTFWNHIVIKAITHTTSPQICTNLDGANSK